MNANPSWCKSDAEYRFGMTRGFPEMLADGLSEHLLGHFSRCTRCHIWSQSKSPMGLAWGLAEALTDWYLKISQEHLPDKLDFLMISPESFLLYGVCYGVDAVFNDFLRLSCSKINATLAKMAAPRESQWCVMPLRAALRRSAAAQPTPCL